MNRKPTKLGNYETLEAKKLMTGDLTMDSSFSSDDVPTEEVAFYYNKIGFAYATTTDGRTFSDTDDMKWDNVKNTSWTDDADTVDETTEATINRLAISLNFEEL